MSFQDKLKESLKNKGLADSSIKMYIRNLIKLNDDLPINKLNFLNNFDDVINKLAKFKKNTVRGYLISIVSVLSLFKNDNKKNEKLFNKYYDHMIKINNEIKEIPKEEKDKNIKMNLITWEDVENKLNELYKEIETFTNKKIINENQYNKLLSLVVLACFVYLPPRRSKDYALLKIVKKYNDNLDKNFNYLDHSNKKLYFNNYKTNSTYGQQVIEIPDNLFNLINLLIKYHPNINNKINSKTNDFLFVNYKNKPLNISNGITLLLNKVFNKKISSSMLRHIYLTSKYKDVNDEKKKDAEMMAHNATTQNNYIV